MMEIKVLGTGCARCHELDKVVRKAVEELGLDASVEKVEDLAGIMSYGVMSTPALVVDGVVRLAGRVPSVAEMKTLLGRA